MGVHLSDLNFMYVTGVCQHRSCEALVVDREGMNKYNINYNRGLSTHITYITPHVLSLHVMLPVISLHAVWRVLHLSVVWHLPSLQVMWYTIPPHVMWDARHCCVLQE